MSTPDFECDALFLIFDTAKHNYHVPSAREVHRHIEACEECGMDINLNHRYSELWDVLEDRFVEFEQVEDYWELFGHDMELDKFRNHVASDDTFHTLDDFAIWYNEVNRDEDLEAYEQLAMTLGLHTRIDPRDVDTIAWSQDFYLGSNGYVFHATEQ